MASTMGTALGRTQASCLPLPLSSVSLVDGGLLTHDASHASSTRLMVYLSNYTDLYLFIHGFRYK